MKKNPEFAKCEQQIRRSACTFAMSDKHLRCLLMFPDLKNIRHIFIPPAYEVYRGYIVFAFSETMFVC